MTNFDIYKIKIHKSQNKKRIDQALTYHLEKFSRSSIKILLVNKNVKKSNKIINTPSLKVAEGEIYEVFVPKIINLKDAPENIKLDIIHEDEDIIIINKKPGMVMHPAPGNKNHTLVNALLYHTKNNLSDINNKRPGIVHRIDKDTSGLIVVAKNNESHNFLAKQFKDHSITRKYYAIVWGVPQNQSIKGYIERNKINRKKMSLNKNGKGKYSETNLILKKIYNICSLVDCSIKTGRTHQIRLHLSSIKFPIIGDKLYGNNNVYKNKNDLKYLLVKNFPRQALHAHILGFLHPRTKKYVEYKTEMPEDMSKLLQFLLKY